MAAYCRVDDLMTTCTPGSDLGPTLGIKYMQKPVPIKVKV